MNSTGFKTIPRFCQSDFLCAFTCVIFFLSLRVGRTSRFLRCICIGFGMWNIWLCSVIDPMMELLLWFLVTFLIKVATVPHWSLAIAPHHPNLKHGLSLLRSLCHSNLSPMGALQSRGKSAPTGSRTSQNGGWEGIHPSCTSDLFNSLQAALGRKTHQV